MCASYESKFSVRELVDAFAKARAQLVFPDGIPNLEPRDEVRPTDVGPMLRARAGAGRGADGTDAVVLEALRFGFAAPVIAGGATGGPKRGPVINFRSEGRSIGNGARGGRGLVPVSGFYEFTGTKYPKTRWVLRAAEAPILMLACVWREKAGGEIDAFALLTGEPGPDIAPYHSRGVLPVPPALWEDWLFDRVASEAVLRPPAAGTLRVEAAPRG